MLRQRVIAQLASYAPGNAPTAAVLHAGMVPGIERREVDEILRGLKDAGLATADRKSRWRLTARGYEARGR